MFPAAIWAAFHGQGFDGGDGGFDEDGAQAFRGDGVVDALVVADLDRVDFWPEGADGDRRFAGGLGWGLDDHGAMGSGDAPWWMSLRALGSARDVCFAICLSGETRAGR